MAIQEIVTSVKACPHCNTFPQPHDIRILHPDNPMRNETFQYAYQERLCSTIEMEYSCACGLHSQYYRYFSWGKEGHLFIAPMQERV